MLNALFEWEARHPTFTASMPRTVDQLIEEVKANSKQQNASLKNVKIPALRNFKRHGRARHDEEENPTARLLRSLGSYKLTTCPEVTAAEKFFEEFVNLTWEDYKWEPEVEEKLK